jgi:hypothetical protein
LQSLNSVLQPPEPQSRCDDRRKEKMAHKNKGAGSRSRKLLKKEKQKEKEKGASPRGEHLPHLKSTCLLHAFCFPFFSPAATRKQLLILYS